MDRTQAPHHIDISSGRRGFRDQNIANGQIGTRVDTLFLNSIQEEIMTVIEKAGLQADGSDWTQLWQALNRLNMPGYQGRHNWHAVKALDMTTPPANASAGDAYLIPAGAQKAWAGHEGNIALRDEQGWIFIDPQDGHGIGLPDSSVYVREAGEYKLLRLTYQNWFDLRYARFSTPPVDTFYVNAATGDDDNDGTSQASAFKTIQGAVDVLTAKYITFAQITVQVAPGEYDGVNIGASLISDWKFIGDKDNPASTVIKATSLDVNYGRGLVVYASDVHVEGFKFQSYYENIATAGGMLVVKNCHINMPPTTFAVGCWGGAMDLYGTINVSGTGNVIFAASTGTRLRIGYYDAATSRPCSIIYNDVTANFNFSAATSGSIGFHSNVVSFSGNLWAKKYYASMNGVIETAMAGANWIYGNQAGGVSTGRQVV